MFRKLKYRQVTWIDLESPMPEELKEIDRDYQIPPLVLEELTTPSRRMRADIYRHQVYLVFHFPRCRLCLNGSSSVFDPEEDEVDFLIGKNFLLTVHYRPINALADFAKIFDSGLVLKKSDDEFNGPTVFFYLMRELYGSVEDGLHFINDRLRRVEKQIFAEREKEAVRDLSAINRELLDCRWALKSHQETIDSLVEAEEVFGSAFRPYQRSLAGVSERLWLMVESNLATFRDLRQTNDSLISIRVNQTMKVLAAVAFIFLPLTVIPQIFGMNTAVPLIARARGFLGVLFLMTAATLTTYLFARWRRWI